MVVEPQPGSLVVMEGEHQLGQTDHALSILTMEIVLLMAVATVHQLGPREQKHQLTVFKMDFRLAQRLLVTAVVEAMHTYLPLAQTICFSPSMLM